MSKKLLLADDSITIQKVIGITFANEDFDLIITDNGDAALEKARVERPDLILADVYMPGKNGYELCAAVKQDQGLKHIPVLLLTGTFEPFDETKAKSVGADGWIAKPFESQALIHQVDELLSKAPAAAPVVDIPAVPEAPEIPMVPESPMVPEGAVELPEEDMWADMGELESEPEPPAAAAEPAGQPSIEKEWEAGLVSEGKEETEEDLWGSVSFDGEDLGEEEIASADGMVDVGEGEEFEAFEIEAEEDAGPESGVGLSERETDLTFGEEEFFEFEGEPSTAESPSPAEAQAAVEFEEEVFEFEEEPVAPATLEPELPQEKESSASFELEEDVFEFEEDEPAPTEPSAPAGDMGAAELAVDEFEFEEEFESVGSTAIEKEEEAGPVESPDVEMEEEILSLDEVEILEEEDLDVESEETFLPEEDVEPEVPAFEEEKTEPFPPLTEEPSDELPHPEYQHPAGEGEWGFEEPLPAAEVPAGEVEPVPSEAVAPAELVPPTPAVAPAVPAATAEEQVARLTEEELQQVVEKVAGQVIERLAGTLLEKIAWEVVPDLAESIIREELRQIKEAAE